MLGSKGAGARWTWSGCGGSARHARIDGRGVGDKLMSLHNDRDSEIVMLAAVVAFNLICTGSLSITDASDKRIEPYSVEYRVDLANRLWCSGDCGMKREIAIIGQNEIALSYLRNSSGWLEDAIVLDRNTGAHTASSVEVTERGRLSRHWKGKCETRPFSGFPKDKRAF